MFRTGTNVPIKKKDIPGALLDFYNTSKRYGVGVEIVIGTDSQNFDQTKMVSVIAIVCHGHGGRFFYEVTRKPLIQNVRLKLQTETAASLELASALLEKLESDARYKDLYRNCPISIHIDAGNSERGKTKALIPELVGWIKACGFDCKMKPDSYVSSSIADRLSK